MRWIIMMALAVTIAAPAWAQGPDGAALAFDGVDDWVDFGTGVAANSPFTIECWVKPTQASAAPQLIAGPFGADSGGCYQGAGFRVNPGTSTEPGALAFAVGLAGCGNDDLIEGPVPTLGQWYHLAGTYDGSTMRFYVDGVLAGELTNIDYTPYARFVAGASYSAYAGGPVFFFGGEIDDLRFWDHVRDQAQIDGGRFDALQGDETGLTAYWSFDEGSGQVAGELVAGLSDGRLGDNADAAGDAADPTWVSVGEPEPEPEPEPDVVTIDDLMDAVKSLDGRHCHKRRLLNRLRIAKKLLGDDKSCNDKAAVYMLKAFVKAVSKAGGKKLSESKADELIGMALDIIEQVDLAEHDRRRCHKHHKHHKHHHHHHKHKHGAH